MTMIVVVELSRIRTNNTVIPIYIPTKEGRQIYIHETPEGKMKFLYKRVFKQSLELDRSIEKPGERNIYAAASRHLMDIPENERLFLSKSRLTVRTRAKC